MGAVQGLQSVALLEPTTVLKVSAGNTTKHTLSVMFWVLWVAPWTHSTEEEHRDKARSPDRCLLNKDHGTQQVQSTHGSCSLAQRRLVQCAIGCM